LAPRSPSAAWADDQRNHAASAAILQKYTPFASGLLPKMQRAQYGKVFDTSIMQPLLDAAYEQKSLAKPIAAKVLLSSIAVTRSG